MIKSINIFLISSIFAILIISCNSNYEINYWKNGTIKSEGSLLNNKRTGKWMFYSEDGKDSTVINYKDGYRNGYFFNYGDSGRLLIKGYYVNGKKHGIWKNNFGYRLKITAYFEEGVLQDRLMYLDTVNSIMKLIKIKNGKTDQMQFIFDFKTKQISYDIVESIPFVFLIDPDSLPRLEYKLY